MLDKVSGPQTTNPNRVVARSPPPNAVLEETLAVCFICKKRLRRSRTANAGDYTKEDVFPRWLVETFELQDAVIDFPDGKSARYGDILVPCCQPCNNDYMSPVEERISKAVKAPDQYPEFIKLSRSDMALWAIKIIYGILFHRIAPWNFNKHRPRPTGISDQVLDQFRFSQKLLDGFRKRVLLSGTDFPLSILVLPIKPGATGELAFDYKDYIEWPTAIAIRMGTVGFIAIFEDFSVVNEWFKTERAALIEGKQLHPLQFMEIAARAFEVAGLGSHKVRCTVMESPRDVHLFLRIAVNAPRDPDPKRLHEKIAYMTGDESFTDKKPGASYLTEADGSFREMRWPPLIE
jgi:hypothetical protein